MASVSTLSFLESRLSAKSGLFNVKFHFGHKISFLKSSLYVKSRFVKSRLSCIIFAAIVELISGYFELNHPGGFSSAWIPRYVCAILMAAIHACITFLAKQNFPCPRGYIGPGGLHDGSRFRNCTGGIAREIDETLFGRNHIYQRCTAEKVYHTSQPFDPEGFLGTLTTIVLVFIGVEAGRILFKARNPYVKIFLFSFSSVIFGLTAGALCGFSRDEGIVPVNKNLWSLSFIFATASMAFVMFILIFLWVDFYKVSDLDLLVSAGMNSIALYFGHEVLKGYFPFAWRPFSQGHGERLAMNLWATFLWLVISKLMRKAKLFISL